MKLTDTEAKKLLKNVRFPELEENIEYMEEIDREGRSDMQILADEASYIFDMYAEGGNIFTEDLEEAREWLRETENGKVLKTDHIPTQAELAHWKNQTDQAKESINSYNRLKRLVKKLESKGY